MMNQQEILRKIGRIIQELQDQYHYLNGTPEINLLELELFTANADFLIDHIEILKKLSGQAEALKYHHKENPVIPTDNVISTAFTGNIKEENLEESTDEVKQEIGINNEQDVLEKPVFDFSFEEEPTEMIFDFDKKVAVEDVFDRELSEEEKELLKSKSFKTEPIFEPTLEEEEEGPEPFLITKEIEETQLESVENEAPIILISDVSEDEIQNPVEDKKEEKMTLNELLSSKLEPKTNHLQTAGKASVDLKTAISLNDKMIFIKALFNGYNLAYSEAIEILNRFESFEAADNFLLKNYATKNNWAEKQDVVDRFYEYLTRKFIK